MIKIKYIIMAMLISIIPLSAGIKQQIKTDVLEESIKGLTLEEKKIVFLQIQKKDKVFPLILDSATSIITINDGSLINSISVLVSVNKIELLRIINENMKLQGKKPFLEISKKFEGVLGVSVFKSMRSELCTDKVNSFFINEGIAIEYRYLWDKKDTIVEFTIDKTDCKDFYLN